MTPEEQQAELKKQQLEHDQKMAALMASHRRAVRNLEGRLRDLITTLTAVRDTTNEPETRAMADNELRKR